MLKRLIVISAVLMSACSASSAISSLNSTIDSLKMIHDSCAGYIENNEMTVRAGESIYKAHYDFKRNVLELKPASIKSDLDPTFRLENGSIYKIVMSAKPSFWN